MIANGTGVGAWEKFQAADLGGDGTGTGTGTGTGSLIALKANATGQWVSIGIGTVLSATVGSDIMTLTTAEAYANLTV
jgi:hypothetical protein